LLSQLLLGSLLLLSRLLHLLILDVSENHIVIMLEQDQCLHPLYQHVSLLLWECGFKPLYGQGHHLNWGLVIGVGAPNDESR
jgi:hypothetical protein